MVVRSWIREQIEGIGGRHDEPALYEGPAGDPGLVGGPDSISWEINGDMASVLLAGAAAIIMEVLHPSVMAGVFEQSSYRTQPLHRAQNTLGYVLRTTFASTEAATSVIERVKRVHARVNGTRPDGVPYRALDPELVAWVHTCIPWAIMESFHRYRRPLTVEEKDRYLAEQAVVGRMGGADRVPESVAELDEYAERMRPLMAMTEQTREFIDFLAGDTGDQNRASSREQLDRRLGLATSMTLMPAWARHLTGTYLADPVRRLYLVPSAHVQARAIRWAYPEPPCRSMALARVGRRPGDRQPAGAGQQSRQSGRSGAVSFHERT